MENVRNNNPQKENTMKRLSVLLAIVLIGCAAPQTQPLSLSISAPPGVAVEKSDLEKISKSMKVENDQLEFKKIRVCGDAAYMTIMDIGGWGSSGDDLWLDFQLLRNREIKRLYIFLLSPGGAAYQGLSISDEIRLLKADNVYVEIHGSGLIASAAVPIFLSASKRVASKNTTFLLHPAALGKGGYFSETLSDLQSQAKMIQMINDQYVGIVVGNSKVTDEQARRMIEKDTWISIDEALEYGFVDEIK